jgi:hypothetical protein
MDARHALLPGAHKVFMERDVEGDAQLVGALNPNPSNPNHMERCQLDVESDAQLVGGWFGFADASSVPNVLMSAVCPMC